MPWWISSILLVLLLIISNISCCKVEVNRFVDWWDDHHWHIILLRTEIHRPRHFLETVFFFFGVCRNIMLIFIAPPQYYQLARKPNSQSSSSVLYTCKCERDNGSLQSDQCCLDYYVLLRNLIDVQIIFLSWEDVHAVNLLSGVDITA